LPFCMSIEAITMTYFTVLLGGESIGG